VSQKNQKTPRKKLYKRADPTTLRRPVWADRDIEIVKQIYLHRGLTLPQIVALLFPGDVKRQQIYKQQNEQVKKPGEGRANQARRRVRLLFDHGLVGRYEQPTSIREGRKPFLYYLEEEGVKKLCKLWGKDLDDLDWEYKHIRKMSYSNVPHFVGNNTIRIAITLSAQALNFSIPIWYDDFTLKSQEMKDYVEIVTPTGKSRQVAVIADDYFKLDTPDYDFHFLIEFDRGTERGKVWADKIRAHLEYYNSGKYEQRYGTTGQRIITVTTSQRRLDKLKGITEKVGGQNRFWFCLFEHFSLEPPYTVLKEKICEIAGRNDRVSIV